MEIRSLFKSKSKSTPSEYFLAVEIHDSLLKTAVWQVEDEKVSVASVGTFEAWEDVDSLVNGLDVSLTQAVKGLDVEPDRVIFGLPESWLDGDKLDSERAHLIKNIINELSLKPIGLVTITEAILQQLKADEGIPATAILLEVYQTKVIVSLVRVGQVEKQEEVGRSDDLAKDVEEGLTRMESERLPVRFILTNGSDLENEEQQIVSYPWLEKLNFFHLPKVETLPADFSIRAIALSGGSEAAKSLGLEMESGITSVISPNTVVEDTLESFGFSVEQTGPPPPIEEVTESTAPETDDYITENISDKTVVDVEIPVEESNVSISSATPTSRKKLAIPAIDFRRLRPRLPKISGSLGFPKLFLFVTSLIIIVLPAIVYLFYALTARADIVIKIRQKSISQEVSLFLADVPQPDKTTIPIVLQDIDISVSKSVPTTGEAVVGDPSVGQVTIYNRSAEKRILKAGTKITATTGQEFTLDTGLEISSSSADINPPFIITPGSASVSVTASRIGIESNLDKGTQFSVGNYPKSVLIATSNLDFTAGSSRTVKAVDKADIATLMNLASGQIQTEIDAKVASLDPDQRSLVVSEYQSVKKNFSKEIGQEAANISLDLSVTVPILIYSHTRLVEVISTDIVAKNQPGMRLLPEQTSIELQKPVKTSGNVYATTAKIRGVIIPSVNTDDYKEIILGKSVGEAARLLQTIAGSSGVTITVVPAIPLLSTKMPSQSSRISINIIVE